MEVYRVYCSPSSRLKGCVHPGRNRRHPSVAGRQSGKQGDKRKEGVGKGGAKRGREQREGDETERKGREKKERRRGIGVFILAGLCCHYFSACTLFSPSLSGEYLHHSRLPARGTHQVQGGRVGKTAQPLL